MAASAKSPVARKRGLTARERDEAITGYLFLSPYLLVTAIFTVGIIAFALYISFTSYNLFQAPQFNGLENYQKALTDTNGFIRSLVNIFWYVITVVPFQTAAALMLALILNRKIRGQQFFRTIFYGPSVTSSIVISAIFLWLYLKTGYVNFMFDRIFGLFGADWSAIEWLNDPRGLFQLIANAFGGDIPSNLWYLRGPSITWMAIMFMNIFTTAPTFMIMYLAALQDVPPTLYEAASIDGADGRQAFWNVTLPMLRPVTLLIVVLGTIGAFQVFDQVQFLTAGGPLNTTLTPVYLIYGEALGRIGGGSIIRMGYASAMAFLLAIIIFIFTLIQRRYIESGTEQY
ncbi:MAG: sugar ABC transporter permease [Anaerolineales bacterium]|nr:sugar ABC transporter permease [Anaerolineales bacterium]MCB9126622.1 sugar ABC transporter permease [Ardenticatenales bacterium]